MSIDTQAPRSSMTVNYTGAGNYRIDQAQERRTRVGNRQDLDGDGVVDGEALTGETGRVVNEGALNQLLAARGLQMRNGVAQALDGSQLGTGVAALTDFRGPPPMPRPAASQASANAMYNRSRALEMGQGIEDSALMWQALNTMAVSSMREMKDAREVKQAMQRGKVEAKKNEIEATHRQIEAERDAARTAFAWSVVGAVATIALSKIGDGKMISDTAAGAIGNTIQKFGEMQSKTSGAQSRADSERMRAMREQMQQEVFEQGVDGAKASYDEAREQFRLAVKVITEFYERQTQATNALTRG